MIPKVKSSDVLLDRHWQRYWRYLGDDYDSTSRCTVSGWTGLVHPGISFAVALTEASHIKIYQLVDWDCYDAGSSDTRVFSQPYCITSGVLAGLPSRRHGSGSNQLRYPTTESIGVFKNLAPGDYAFGIWLTTPDNALEAEHAIIYLDIAKA